MPFYQRICLIIKCLINITLLYFANNLPDHRQQVKALHKATDIVPITAAAAVICGAQDWEDVAALGECKEDFFRKYLELPNGIPSHDTFNRFFSNLDPEAMEVQFRLRVKGLCSETTELIAIDGKTIRSARSGEEFIPHGQCILYCQRRKPGSGKNLRKIE